MTEPVSKLVIGTAQFGMPYGIANGNGQVKKEEIVQPSFYNRKGLEHSNHFYQHCLSIPIYVDLANENQLKVINSL